MSVRTLFAIAALATAALVVASPAQSASWVCENVDNPLLHVGVAADPQEPCRQDCPSMVNVNVAVSVTGAIHQCSGSGNLLNSQAHVPVCAIAQGAGTGECAHHGEGLWGYVECISRPGLGICPFPPLDVR